MESTIQNLIPASDNKKDGTSETQCIGHIASLAVNEKFRGSGVAKSLMQSLHYSFANNYNIDAVTLYCRVRLIYTYICIYILIVISFLYLSDFECSRDKFILTHFIIQM